MQIILLEILGVIKMGIQVARKWSFKALSFLVLGATRLLSFVGKVGGNLGRSNAVLLSLVKWQAASHERTSPTEAAIWRHK